MPPKAAAKGAALTKKPSYMDKIQVSICQIACCSSLFVRVR